VKLNSVNLALARPNAFLHAIRESHPTLAERIEFANTYRPWERGERLKYQEHFSGK
jgi:STE24 endopeptidase